MSDIQLDFAGNDLDRAGYLRKKPDWILSQLSKPETKIIPVWNDKNLVSGIGNILIQPKAVTCSGDIAAKFLKLSSDVVFLGLDKGTAYFTIDLSGYKQNEIINIIGECSFVSLRNVRSILTQKDAKLLAYAKGILFNHINYRYCSKCGNITKSAEGGHVKVCSNPNCNNEIFPRTDPAVIMLVINKSSEDGIERCLLGNNVAWGKGVYSTLAGFVEPGESLEEAVKREVYEEVGIRLDKVIYQTSQPWPFPTSIMVGFLAYTDDSDIKVDKEEIRTAEWFSAEDLSTFGEWGDEASSHRLSSKGSISRYLIDTWINEN
ncbi:MAG TPA: NAD(+) diphosphatase [Victivallales bacterium]|nr:NAD(+) diphosphatase [Victivallales bacterium]